MNRGPHGRNFKVKRALSLNSTTQVNLTAETMPNSYLLTSSNQVGYVGLEPNLVKKLRHPEKSSLLQHRIL